MRVVVPTPSGERFTQRLAQELAGEPRLVFACGRYEGIDQRVLDDLGERARVCEVSLGDFVVNGGEVAVLAIVEAVARLLPGVIGNAESLVLESHADGLLEGPAFTKPPEWRGRSVPDVLLSGNHAQIDRWRRDESLRRTASRRPDLITLLDPAGLDRTDQALLAELGWRRRGRSGRPRAIGPHATACGRLSGCCHRPTGALPQGERVTRTGRGHETTPSPTYVGDLWHREKEIPMQILDAVDAASLRSDIPDFRPGDTLKVHVKVIEGTRSRIQVFQGVAIRRQGDGIRETFTVRKVSFGVGVERTFPVHTPVIDKIEVVTRGDVRRAKLYYLRDLRGKAAKIKERRDPVTGR